MTSLKSLPDHGQAVWLDFLSRGFIAKDELSGAAIDVLLDFPCQQIAMLIAAFVRLAFNVDIQPAAARIAIRAPIEWPSIV